MYSMSNYMKLRKGTKGIKKNHKVLTGRLVTRIFFIEKLIYLNIKKPNRLPHVIRAASHLLQTEMIF